MKLRALLFSSALLGVAVHAAHAADSSTPAAGGSHDWSGFYAGATGSFGWGNTQFTATEPLTGAPLELRINSTDYGVGAFAGYNWGFGTGFIAGIEADAEYIWRDGEEELGDGVVGGVDNGFQGSLRVRAGLAFDRVLLFGTAGIAYGQATIYDPGDPPLGFDRVEANADGIGWTAGAGADVAFTDRLFGRIEYRYTDFGPTGLSIPDAPSDIVLNADPELSWHSHTVRAGIGIQF